MSETLLGLQELWNQYYPIVVAGGLSIVAVAGGIYAVWSQIKPLLNKFSELKDKVEETKVSDISKQLESITLDTRITDLKAKIANPTVSAELKEQYMTQLEQLLTIQAKIQAGLVKAEEITSKF